MFFLKKLMLIVMCGLMCAGCGKKTLNEIQSDIVNKYYELNAYEAIMDVRVYSNKNIREYQMKQVYSSPNTYSSEVLKPVEIKGVKSTFDGKTLTVMNPNIPDEKIFENYNVPAENPMFLSYFLNRYYNKDSRTVEGNNNFTIMKAQMINNDMSINRGELTIDNKTKLPIKLEYYDVNGKLKFDIIYNEFKFNPKR